MNRACSTNEGEDKGVLVVGGKAKGKEAQLHRAS
jgi:hypothetical protein